MLRTMSIMIFIDMSPRLTTDFMLSLTSFFQRLTFTLKKQIAIPLVIKQGNFNEVVIGTHLRNWPVFVS
jgi:hypothetical protein